MARASTCINFARSTEEAFTCGTAVVGAEFVGGIAHPIDAPPHPAQPATNDEGERPAMNDQLPILGGHP